tara:strand:- start:821 stop:1102 length:282 start_codon:yes stop_codon:yes gene_type:complete
MIQKNFNIFKVSKDEKFSNWIRYALTIEDNVDILSNNLENIAKHTSMISKEEKIKARITYSVPKEELLNYLCSNLDKDEIKTLDKYLDKLKVF